MVGRTAILSWRAPTPTQIARVRRKLLRWGRANFKPYAWRFETDPWLSLVAELLLQRTRASQVEPVFLRFKRRYPTAESLVKAGGAANKKLTARLGLHQRGSFLIAAARRVVDLGGSMPPDLETLGNLKGVGMYTKAAWLSLHRGKRAAIVDSNVARWLSRMTGQPYNRDPRGVFWIQSLADRITPQRAFCEYNYAVLDFTMSVCVPKIPQCDICPIRSDCSFGQHARRDKTIRNSKIRRQ
jgi:A/G-specific adenine glycosylase